MLDLSVILLLYNREGDVATMVRSAVAVTNRQADTSRPSLSHEALALDEHSRDNTLSVLSMLAPKFPTLHAIPGLAPGTAVRRGVERARGRVLMLVDHAAAVTDARWCLEQVLGGKCAAAVPGEVLVVGRKLALRCLTRRRAGLVRAQQIVRRALRARVERMATRSPDLPHISDRARLLVRQRLTRFGLTRFDRPRGT
ncbi:MAG: glycosyltransferase [Nannocystaceae bacterium]